MLLLLIIIGLSFYVGTLQAQKGRGGGVTLSCSDDVLSALAIPAASRATGQKIQQNKNNDLSIYPQDTTSGASLEDQSAPSPATTGAYLGSKNGTKYYTPDCPAAKRIKPENTVWFQTAEDATLQGYSPASC
jgi:hypothetical protein